MAAVVDDYVESPMENEEVFPCKGCGDILEEGKAFELAGNRWHLDCFRCNTCGTLLDSDANLLLLGDGSLICNNCTYSCSACGNKIEELAILTGEQAFCATCFRCRNCKRKIENLRYARTSQGIFCMSCHESLMARRRKKSKTTAHTKSREKDGSPMITDKSLPALPPNAIPPNAFSETRVDPESDTPTELSPRPRPSYTRHDSRSRTRSNSRPARSPERSLDGQARDALGLSPASYRNHPAQSTTSSGAENGGKEDGFFIPVALDPTPSSSASRDRSASDYRGDPPKKKERENIGQTDASSEKKNDASSPSTPHIAFQEMWKQPSSDDHPKLPLRKPSKSSRNESSTASPTTEERTQKTVASRPPPSAQEEFKLQDAPKTKKASISASIDQSPIAQQSDEGFGRRGSEPLRKESLSSAHVAGSPPQLRARNSNREPKSSLDSRRQDETDSRSSTEAKSQSRQGAPSHKSITRKDVPANTRLPNSKSGAPPVTRAANDDSSSPGSSTSRATAPEPKRGDSYMQPRAPPQPPSSGAPATVKEGKEAPTSSDGKGEKTSPKLPRWSSGGDFTMDEDMARILGTDEPSSSLLRRVSNAVRHGRTNSTESAHQHYQHHHRMSSGHARSASETTSPRWPKSSAGLDDPGAHDISSPLPITSPDDPAFLKRKLRNSEQKVAELERQFTTEKDIKNLNKKLLEKRKTVSTLDTQTEIMIRQLEVLAGYVERAKETKAPVDPRELEESAIKDFVQKLDRVKYSMSEIIEQLHTERDGLVEEKNQAMADRDRALLEFEQLSAKNAQLADLNNDLAHQIQGRFKSQIGDIKSPPGGLGLYPQSKGPSGSSVNLAEASSVTTATTLLPPDSEEPVVEARPTVVDIRKGQAKKFNWKKGSKTMAQNIAKGVNRTVGAFQQEREGRHQGLTADNIGMPYNMTVAQVESPVTPITSNGTQNRHQQQLNESRQGFGFFKKNQMAKSTSNTNLNAPAPAEPPSTLFGSELMDRVEFERRQIPTVVTRCIEEVELRGMDIEGIYRKTGGNSQVKMVQEGFDKNEDFDISDPELDITAVTSVLKQYFRKLPTPLLTFDIYDKILESNAIADSTERCDFLRKLFAEMPQSHRDCLEFLMFHLSRVANREPENLMSPKNLSVVFAPTIMRDTSLEREMTDMHAKNLAVQFVVEYSQTIFTE